MDQSPKVKTGWMHPLLWGLCLRCPRCGQGRLFRHFYHQLPLCTHCGLRYVPDATDILALMYISTALITGIFILGMFFIVPKDPLWGRIILGSLALMTIVGTLPIRKGMAIGINYLINRSGD